jgi:hypothetical protein
MSDAVATFLRASIVPEVPASHLAGLADGVDLTGLPARADYHGISGYVLQGLRGAVADGVPVEPAVVAELERLQAEARIRQLLVRRDLAWLQTHLEEWEVPWLVLKGPVLSDRVHPGGALRSYRDLDVLVSGARFVEVVRALGRAGAEPSPEARAAAPGTTEGELSLRLPDGTVLDLHQHILTAHRERFEVDVAGMLSRRRVVRLRDGAEVPTFDETDTVLHLALHAVSAGGHRLVWWADLRHCIERDPPSWHELVDRARRTRTTSVLALALGVAEDQGVQVPVDLRELAVSPRWVASVRRAWRAQPPGAALGRERSLAKALTRSTCDSLAGSLRDVGRRARSVLAHPAGEASRPRAVDDTARLSRYQGGRGRREL